MVVGGRTEEVGLWLYMCNPRKRQVLVREGEVLMVVSCTLLEDFVTGMCRRSSRRVLLRDLWMTSCSCDLVYMGQVWKREFLLLEYWCSAFESVG